MIAAVRQFEVSAAQATPPFGASDNFARSVGRRIGADPARAILEVVGGQGPQRLVNELAHAVARGEMGTVLLVGAEAISTVRRLQAQGETRDWSEAVGGQLEDRGYGTDGLASPELAAHGARAPIQLYALFENARRARLGLGRRAYARALGELLAPFTQVAAANPHAMSREVLSAAEIATVDARNRLVADPFPRRVVSRDQANQGAALILTSRRRALALGVPEGRLVHLHGGADVRERAPMERADLGASPAAVSACRHALAAAGVGMHRMAHLDLYSCFPVAVFNITDAFDLPADGARALTVTGGLPFFGGAGNNYAMHAIAGLVRRLRAEPGSFGLVGANGGYLSKYSVGVYSTTPGWTPFDSRDLQAQVDAWPAPARARGAVAAATVETYTIDHTREPARAIVVGRTPEGARVAASSEDPAVVQAMTRDDPLGGRVDLAPDACGRRAVVAFRPAASEALA